MMVWSNVLNAGGLYVMPVGPAIVELVTMQHRSGTMVITEHERAILKIEEIIEMSKIDTVIKKLQNKEDPVSIASQMKWESITNEEREQFLGCAQNPALIEIQRDLLVFLFRLSRDDWYTIRVLSIVARSKNMDLSIRVNTLNTIKKRLDRLGTSIQNIPANDPLRKLYAIYKAINLMIEGELAQDQGLINEAAQYYKNSMAIYERTNLSQPANSVKQLIEKIQIEPILKEPAPDIAGKQKEYEKLAALCLELNNKIAAQERLRQEKEIEISVTEQKLIKGNEKLSLLQTYKKNYEDNCAELEDKVKKLKEAFETQSALISKVMIVKDINVLGRDLHNLEKEKETLKNELTAMSGQKAALTTERTSLETKCKEFSREVGKKQEEVARLESDRIRLQREVTRMLNDREKPISPQPLEEGVSSNKDLPSFLVGQI
jgi:hypothetical protein